MSSGAVFTIIVAMLVFVGARALFVRASVARRQVRQSQTHSAVKPAPLADEVKLVQARGREEIG
jgi:hypothetical protein